MRTLRLTLCLIGLATLYPAVSNAAQMCYSAFVPAANPQWRNGCDGEMAGTTGHNWGVTRYAINSPSTLIGGGSICYRVYTSGGWSTDQCNGSPTSSQPNGIRLLRVTSYTGPSTLMYRAHVGNYGWDATPTTYNPNVVLGRADQTLQALEVNIMFPGESEYWQP